MTRKQTLDYLKSSIDEIKKLDEKDFEKVGEIFKDCFNKYLSVNSNHFEDSFEGLLFEKNKSFNAPYFEKEIKSFSEKITSYSLDNFIQVKLSILMMTPFLE